MDYICINVAVRNTLQVKTGKQIPFHPTYPIFKYIIPKQRKMWKIQRRVFLLMFSLYFVNRLWSDSSLLTGRREVLSQAKQVLGGMQNSERTWREHLSWYPSGRVEMNVILHMYDFWITFTRLDILEQTTRSYIHSTLSSRSFIC